MPYLVLIAVVFFCLAFLGQHRRAMVACESGESLLALFLMGASAFMGMGIVGTIVFQYLFK